MRNKFYIPIIRLIRVQTNNGDACGPGFTLIRLQALRSLAGIRYNPYRGKTTKKKRWAFSNPPRYI